ncbi:MAG: L-lactate permease [Chloroflexi bacterium]|nr:L-lactate permease [Chloroflexota bacterium]
MTTKFGRILLYVFLPLFVLLTLNQVTQNNVPGLRYFLAAAPILVVLIIMIAFRVAGQYAGPIGLLTGIVVASQAFGLSLSVLWVSQAKGIILSLFVIAVFLPALFLYNIVNQAGGIQAVAQALEKLITDRGILLIVIAWAFSAMLEGLAGFGLPVAIVSPMLVGLGIDPILAVASVAIGHAWAVTFGDMGVVFQTLTALVKEDPASLASTVTIMLGIAGLFCGLAVAKLFKRLDRWPVVILLAGLMGFVQYICAVSQLSALASLLAGLSGVLGGIFINRIWFRQNNAAPSQGVESPDGAKPKMSRSLTSALVSYGLLALIMAIINLILPLRQALGQVVWTVSFPEVQTLSGFVTAAKHNQTYQPLIHPGTTILLVALLSYLANKKAGFYQSTGFWKITALTLNSTLPAIVGILAMVGLSTLMDHTGMNLLLAKLLSNVFYGAFPLVSPLLGMLGAFATGSNNNSNVLFASLQEGIALILKLSPAILVSAQTTGGSLGSMIAPAKVIVGLSTVNRQGHEGEVLRTTIPYGLAIGLIMGVVTLILTKLMG